MTSPLLIIFANREGSHWVLATFPFIQGLCLLNSMGVRKYKDHLQATRRFGRSHSCLSHWPGPIFVSPPLKGELYLALVSARLGMTLVPFWGCLYHMVWWLGRFNYLGWQILQDLMKKYLIRIPITPPGVVQT